MTLFLVNAHQLFIYYDNCLLYVWHCTITSVTNNVLITLKLLFVNDSVKLVCYSWCSKFNLNIDLIGR